MGCFHVSHGSTGTKIKYLKGWGNVDHSLVVSVYLTYKKKRKEKRVRQEYLVSKEKESGLLGRLKVGLIIKLQKLSES